MSQLVPRILPNGKPSSQACRPRASRIIRIRLQWIPWKQVLLEWRKIELDGAKYQTVMTYQWYDNHEHPFSRDHIPMPLWYSTSCYGRLTEKRGKISGQRGIVRSDEWDNDLLPGERFSIVRLWNDESFGWMSCVRVQPMKTPRIRWITAARIAHHERGREILQSREPFAPCQVEVSVNEPTSSSKHRENPRWNRVDCR